MEHPAAGFSRGFTVIEAMTVVSLLAIVTSLAIPGLRDFLAGQRIRALSYDLTADLLLARSEALKRSAAVVIARSGTDWDGGWSTVAGATRLSQRNAVLDRIVFNGAPASITFDRNGRVSAPLAPVRITLTSTAAGVTAQRCVALDLSGRARATVGACA